MRKILKSIFVTGAFLLTATCSHASTLPTDMWEYIKQSLPDARQRFDSVIELPSGSLYIPLYPAQEIVNDEIKIEYTYPKTTTLKSLPEVVLFNNNFALMRATKNKNGTYSLTKNENLPLKVRLGIMPQDMLVPAGLELPDSLKILLGDLVIPSKDSGSLALDSEDFMADIDDKKAKNRIIKKNIKPIPELKNKKLFIGQNNSKFIAVYDIAKSDTIYELKLQGLPSKIVSSNKTKFAIVLYFLNKNADIIDLQDERIIAHIDFDDVAKDVVLDEEKNIAYISLPAAKKIYVVSMDSGRLEKEIKLNQSPDKLAISKNNKLLGFIDAGTQDIYTMDLASEDLVVRKIASTENISKIILGEDKIYAISRTANLLRAYSLADCSLADEELLSEKPIDVVMFEDKIYILCAKNGYINTYDTLKGEVIKTTELDNRGFYTKISKIPNTNFAFITGVDTKNFIYFNLETSEIVTKRQLNHDTHHVIMVDK